MIFEWAAFFVHALFAFGLVFVAFHYARRIGGFGPQLLAVVPALDVLGSAAARLADASLSTWVRTGHGTVARMADVFRVIGGMNAALGVVSLVVLVSALVLMRRPS